MKKVFRKYEILIYIITSIIIVGTVIYIFFGDTLFNIKKTKKTVVKEETAKTEYYMDFDLEEDIIVEMSSDNEIIKIYNEKDEKDALPSIITGKEKLDDLLKIIINDRMQNGNNGINMIISGSDTEKLYNNEKLMQEKINTLLNNNNEVDVNIRKVLNEDFLLIDETMKMMESDAGFFEFIKEDNYIVNDKSFYIEEVNGNKDSRGNFNIKINFSQSVIKNGEEVVIIEDSSGKTIEGAIASFKGDKIIVATNKSIEPGLYKIEISGFTDKLGKSLESSKGYVKITKEDLAEGITYFTPSDDYYEEETTYTPPAEKNSNNTEETSKNQNNTNTNTNTNSNNTNSNNTNNQTDTTTENKDSNKTENSGNGLVSGTEEKEVIPEEE